jgi:hypothetical protein
MHAGHPSFSEELAQISRYKLTITKGKKLRSRAPRNLMAWLYLHETIQQTAKRIKINLYAEIAVPII